MGLSLKKKKMKQIILITFIILSSNLSIANSEGPVLIEKLTPPEKNQPQTLQKRAFIWIEGQWQTINGSYKWKSGHWTKKRIGYVYINGKWSKKDQGWKWEDGYWKEIDINKWINLYS